MKWNSKLSQQLKWSSPIINKEEKEQVAQKIALRVCDGDVIGFGSGSTSFLTIQAISRRMQNEHITCTAIPTSAEVTFACTSLNIPTTTFLDAHPDWYFDGADEVDPDKRFIKGRGGAMFKEKLLMLSSPKTYILIDKSKLVNSLGTSFPVPVEVFPLAIHFVQQELFALGATEVNLRFAQKKDGPVITENGNFILDAKFAEYPDTLEKEIKSIAGVIESGLFIGYDVEIVIPGT